MRNSIAFGDIHTFLECPKAYQFRSSRIPVPKAIAHMAEVVGNVSHAVIAVKPEERASVLEAQLAAVPEADRKEIKEAVEAVVTAADAMDDGEGDKDKEKKVKYLDPVTGWQLVAKPDQTGWVDGERGRPIFQILDVKTGYRLKRKHKDQIFFFALVICLSMSDYYGPIKLVVRLLGAPESERDQVFWFSRARLDGELEKYRSIIRQIEAARASKQFEARVGWACGSCDFREQCAAYKASQVSAPVPALTPLC